MYNFDPYNVLLAIATNIPVLLMTAFVLQGHIKFYFWQMSKLFHTKSEMNHPQSEGNVNSRLYSWTQEKKSNTLQ